MESARPKDKARRCGQANPRCASLYSRRPTIYQSDGFAHHLMPIPDGGVPTPEQFQEYVRFVDEQLRAGNPTAVHCAAGLGRTGTVLAGYLIEKGVPFETAVTRIRTARPGAIETLAQIRFLESLTASA